jgi:hypothetical protein
MSAKAWVVECAMCHCVIVAFARDPQLEHGKTEAVLPPANSCVLECLCCSSAYRYTGADFVAGVPKRNPACVRKQSSPGKMDGALLIAASLVAAIRMRGAEIKESPKLNSTIYDSITLARMVLSRLEKQPS